MSTGIDLGSLPPELRQKVEQQLAKLSPQSREKILREGGPVIRKLVANLQAAAGGGGPPPLPGAGQHGMSRPPQSVAASVHAAKERAAEAARQVARLMPKGHFNATIRPGDRPGAGRWLLIVLATAVLVAAFWDDSGGAGQRESDTLDEPVEVEAG